MLKVRRSNDQRSARRNGTKNLLYRIAETLMFWRSPAPRPGLAARLSDLWQPTEREALLEREHQLRQERMSRRMMANMEEPEPKSDKRRERRMRREAKRLEKAARKMTRLAMRGRIPLESILPLAFPELEKWKFQAPSKTCGLKPFQYIDVPDSTLGEMLDCLKARPELAPHWSHGLESLCAALAGALLFMAEGGDEDDALTILGLNCGPLRAEAEGCVRALRGASVSKIRQGVAEFAERVVVDPRWNEPPITAESLKALAGVARNEP